MDDLVRIVYSHTRCYILSFKIIGQLVLEKKIFKVLTIYGHGGHVGHVTQTIKTIFLSVRPWRLYMKFGCNQPGSFRGEFV